jgi:hypothetical protein
LYSMYHITMFEPQPSQLFVGVLVISWCIKCRDFFNSQQRLEQKTKLWWMKTDGSNDKM